MPGSRSEKVLESLPPAPAAVVVSVNGDGVRVPDVKSNDPVPLFPYPGSPDYRKLWGLPDDQAWERALDHYLTHHVDFSDIQDQRPRPLHELELATAGSR